MVILLVVLRSDRGGVYYGERGSVELSLFFCGIFRKAERVAFGNLAIGPITHFHTGGIIPKGDSTAVKEIAVDAKAGKAICAEVATE